MDRTEVAVTLAAIAFLLLLFWWMRDTRRLIERLNRMGQVPPGTNPPSKAAERTKHTYGNTFAAISEQDPIIDVIKREVEAGNRRLIDELSRAGMLG